MRDLLKRAVNVAYLPILPTFRMSGVRVKHVGVGAEPFGGPAGVVTEGGVDI